MSAKSYEDKTELILPTDRELCVYAKHIHKLVLKYHLLARVQNHNNLAMRFTPSENPGRKTNVYLQKINKIKKKKERNNSIGIGSCWHVLVCFPQTTLPLL